MKTARETERLRRLEAEFSRLTDKLAAPFEGVADEEVEALVDEAVSATRQRD